jgi:hypothetical protein
MWRHRSGRRRRSRMVRTGIAAGGLVLVAAVLSALGLSDALRARTQLAGARSALQATVDDPAALGTPEGRAAARAQVDGALVAIARARSRIADSAVLSVAGLVPGLRGQRAGLLELIGDAATAAGAGRDLLAAVDGVAGRTQLRDGALPLDGLRQLQQEVGAAGQVLAAQVAGASPRGRRRWARPAPSSARAGLGATWSSPRTTPRCGTRARSCPTWW